MTLLLSLIQLFAAWKEGVTDSSVDDINRGVLAWAVAQVRLHKCCPVRRVSAIRSVCTKLPPQPATEGYSALPQQTAEELKVWERLVWSLYDLFMMNPSAFVMPIRDIMHHEVLEQDVLLSGTFCEKHCADWFYWIFQRLYYLLTLLASLKCWEAKEIGRQSTSRLPTAHAKTGQTMSFPASTFLQSFDSTKTGDGTNYQGTIWTDQGWRSTSARLFPACLAESQILFTTCLIQRIPQPLTMKLWSLVLTTFLSIR